MAARDARVHPARVSQRVRGAGVTLGAPVVGAVVGGDVVQPLGFAGVERLALFLELFQHPEHVFVSYQKPLITQEVFVPQATGIEYSRDHAFPPFVVARMCAAPPAMSTIQPRSRLTKLTARGSAPR